VRITDVARVGEYVLYSPDVTYVSFCVEDSGTTTRQNCVPSKIKEWRVLNNCNGHVELVSVQDMPKMFLQGETGYRNAVAFLNKVCSAYVNRRHAVSARSLGTSEKSISKVNDALTFENIFNTKYAWKTNRTLNDDYFEPDVKTTLHNGFFTRGNGWIWLGSRSVELKDDRCGFAVKAITPEGNVENIPLCMDYSDGRHYNLFECCHVCPVVKLREEVDVVSGDGTKNNPYVLA